MENALILYIVTSLVKNISTVYVTLVTEKQFWILSGCLYNITCLISLSFLCSSAGDCVIELVLFIGAGVAYGFVWVHLYGMNYLK